MNAINIMGARGMDPQVARELARDVLSRAVARGTSNTAPVVQRIIDEVPQDSLVDSRGVSFTPGAQGIQMGAGNQDWTIHPHALGHLAERAGVPVRYLRELDADGVEAGGWKRELGAEILNRHFEHAKRDRYLVRSHNGVARGVLSDKFKRLDSRPLMEAFWTECQAVGAVPYMGAGSDVRVSLKMILPTIVEPTPGECMVWGLSWQNSDYGGAAYSISVFGLRVVCLNGMVSANSLRKQHLGTSISDSFELSARTMELDTATVVSATRDIVRGTLTADAVERECQKIRAASEQELNVDRALRGISKRVSKAEAKRARELFEGSDVVNLPAPKTAWRFSNALSFMANETESFDSQDNLQRLAAEVIGS